MKNKLFASLTLVWLATLNSQLSTLRAQGTGFTYQGRLTDNGSPANGNYDLQFRLRDALLAGNPVGTTNTLAPVAVSNGLFTVPLDFGAGAFTGADRWLDIGLRTNGSAGDYQTLSPRQQLTATPYATRAANFSGAVSDAQLSANVARLNANNVFSGAVQLNNTSNTFAGSFAGNGEGLTNLDGAEIAGNAIGVSNTLGSDLWHIGRFRWGNTLARLRDPTGGPLRMMNTFGGQGAQPFELLVENLWKRIPPRGVMGMFFGNYYAPVFTGGAALTNNLDWYQQHGYLPAGGVITMTNALKDSMHQWNANVVQLDFIQQPNASTNFHLEVSISAGDWTPIGFAGVTNLNASGALAGISKRWTNTSVAPTQVRAVGSNAAVQIIGMSVFEDHGWGLVAADQTQSGGMHLGGLFVYMSGANRTNVLAPVWKSWDLDMVLYTEHTGPDIWTTYLPRLWDLYVNIAGMTTTDFLILGNHPDAEANAATEAGFQRANMELHNMLVTNTWPWNVSYFDTYGILGGVTNALQAGLIDYAYDSSGTERGTKVQAEALAEFLDVSAWGPTHQGQTVLPSGDLTLSDPSRGYVLATGGIWSYGTAQSEVSFGSRNGTFSSRWSWRGSESPTKAELIYANNGEPIFSWTLAPGGTESIAFAGTSLGTFSTPAIFTGNGAGLTSLNGVNLQEGSVTAAKIGGTLNAAQIPNLDASKIASGVLDPNRVPGLDGSKITSGTVADARLSANVALRAGGNAFSGNQTITSGSVGIGTTNPTNTLHVAGGVSATTFVTTSDRHAKENFTPVDPREVLAKVAALPITRWNYKAMNDGPHFGPMAQDFYAAFHLGGSDTTITTVDPDGVALAAIQGLNEKVESGKQRAETRMDKLEAENAKLKERLERLEKLLADSVANH